MRRLILLTTQLMLMTLLSFGQTIKDSTAISVDYGSKDREFLEFLQFMNIDKYSVAVTDTSLKEKVVHIRLREFTNGKVTRVEDFVQQERAYKMLYTFGKKDSSYKFTVWTRKLSHDSLEIFFRFFRHGVSKKFNIHSSNAYSLRNPIPSQNNKYQTPINSFSPFLVYSLPYQDSASPSFFKYCALTAGGVAPDKWGDVYKIPHYILLEIKFD